MSIKIYNVIGIGLLVGERIPQKDGDIDIIYLKYPGALFLGQQTRQGPRDLMTEPVPGAIEGQFELLKRFPLKKRNILYSGRPIASILDLYSQYAKQLQERMSGIKLVNANALNQLPKMGQGKPMIN